MDPFTWLAIISVLVGAAGAATSYAGAQQAAEAADDAGEAQKEAADASARNEELQNAEAVKRERINKRRRLARIRADMNTSGLTMDGSSMDVFAETAGTAELQIQDAARAGNLNAANQRNAGSMALWEARTQAAATRMGSYGTLLSDAGGITSSSYRALS